jgi:HSP20 family protein
MANITRYDPASGVMPLRDAMDRLFQDAFTRPGMWDRSLAGAARWSLPSSLYETKDGYVFHAALPGVRADKLEITAQQNVLVLKGSYVWELPQDARSIWANLPAGEFSYEFSFPGEFDPSGVSADYHDGILTLTLPKAAHAKAHTIKVTANGGAQK